MQDKFIQAYMDVAERFAQLSRARRLQVGAIVVRDNRIISIGYNGTPSGWDNNCENIDLMDADLAASMSPQQILERWPLEGRFWIDRSEIETRYRLVTRPEVMHAERNAIDKLAASNDSSLGADMFITHAPCVECSKSIYAAGIGRVFYRHHYRSADGIDFLHRCGITVTQI